MKKRLLSLFLIAVMVLGMVPAVAFAAPAESSGVYQIGTAEDLLWFAQEVNGGNTAISAVLTADIDMSAVTAWPGIGISSNKFAGSFDGQGHSVTFQNANWGLFGFVQGSSDEVASSVQALPMMQTMPILRIVSTVRLLPQTTPMLPVLLVIHTVLGRLTVQVPTM